MSFDLCNHPAFTPFVLQKILRRLKLKAAVRFAQTTKWSLEQVTSLHGSRIEQVLALAKEKKHFLQTHCYLRGMPASRVYSTYHDQQKYIECLRREIGMVYYKAAQKQVRPEDTVEYERVPGLFNDICSAQNYSSTLFVLCKLEAKLRLALEF